MFEWSLFFTTEDNEISYQDLLSNYEMLVSPYQTNDTAWEIVEEVIEKWSNQYTSVLHLKSFQLNGFDILISRVASTRSGTPQPV
jgi:hypothetical protein